jgi:PHD/YefM family antitoxin component YafN of YafNO toxin-antitoxin module
MTVVQDNIAITKIIAIISTKENVMPQARITSVEMHAKLGATIDRALVEPVVVTKHGRDHLVLLSAERYAALLATARQARRTGSLTPAEIAAAQNATVPSETEQARLLADLVNASAQFEQPAS